MALICAISEPNLVFPKNTPKAILNVVVDSVIYCPVVQLETGEVFQLESSGSC